jgi:hypothetical protein
VGIVFVVPGSRTVMPSTVSSRASGGSPGDLLGTALTTSDQVVAPRAGWRSGDGVPASPAVPGAGSRLLCPGDARPYDGACATWHQDTPSIRGAAEAGDGFGAVLGG